MATQPAQSVGQSIPRLEGKAKVTGRAEYVHHLHLPGMLHGKICRSTVAHGRIRRIDVTAALKDLGAYEVSVSDTIGVAHPGQVRRVLDALLKTTPADAIALHFHDTRGTALANVLAALEFGISTFDSSAGGLGGCPYAPGASGNLATEDVLYMLHGLGYDTGVSLEAVMAASLALEPQLGHALPSRYVAATRGVRRSGP